MRGITAGNLPMTNIEFYVKYRNKLSKDSVKNTTTHINSIQLLLKAFKDYQSHEHVCLKTTFFLPKYICVILHEFFGRSYKSKQSFLKD
jgi:hypothetical protein